MLQIPDRIVLDRQIPRIHIHHTRQRIEVRDRRPLRIVDHLSLATKRQPIDRCQRLAQRHVLTGEVKLLAPHKINRLTRPQRLLWQHRRVRTDQPHLHVPLLRLQRLRQPRIAAQSRRTRVDDHQFIVPRDPQHIVLREIIRRRIHEPRALDQRRRLRQPCGIPKRAHLALRLIARPRPPIEAFPRRRIDEQSLEKCAHPRLLPEIPAQRQSRERPAERRGACRFRRQRSGGASALDWFESDAVCLAAVHSG